MNYDSRHTLRTVTIGAFWRLLRYPFLFLSMIIMPRFMGKETYGQFAYFMSILFVCEAFTGLGNLQIFGRFVPEVNHDRDREARLLHGILMYGTLLVALFTLGVWAFFIAIRPGAFPLRWMPILACIMLASKVQGTIFAFLYGRNEIARYSTRELLRSMLNLILVVGLYAWFRSTESALWGTALTAIGLMLLALWWAREAIFRSWNRLPFREFWPYFLFGLTFYIPSILLFFLQRSAPLFIRSLTGRYEDVATFDLANQFLMTTGMFIGLIFTTLVPALSKLHASGRHAEVLEWNRKALAWCGAASSLVYAFLAYAGRPVINLLLGPDFADTYSVTVVMGLAFSPMLVSQMGLAYSVIEKKPSAYVLSTAVGAIIMIGLSFLLIPRWKAEGAAWATVAGYAAAAIVYAAIFRAPFLTMLKDFLFVIGLGLLAVLPAIWLNDSIPHMLTAGSAAVFLYLGALVSLRILNVSDMNAILRAFGPKKKTVPRDE